MSAAATDFLCSNVIIYDTIVLILFSEMIFLEFSQVIKERYSCKKYDGRKISDEQLTRILEAGRLAPTAKNLQEQHIYVANTPEVLSVIDKHTPCRYNAGTVLIVAFNKDNVYTYPNSTRQSGIEDATIVATHLILAAADIGIDSCWVNCVDIDALKADLRLPDNEEILMLLDLGFAEKGAGPLPNHSLRKELSETVTYLK